MSVAIAAQPAPSAGVAAFLRRPPRLLIGGEWVEPSADDQISVIDPATGDEVAAVADASAADVDKAVAAARHGVRAWPLGHAAACAARGTDLAASRPHRQERRRARGARKHRQRQNEADGRHRRCAGRTKLLPLHGRLGHEDRRRDVRRFSRRPQRWKNQRVHAARARRRRRANHPVEFPARHGGVEARPRARGRVHVHLETRGTNSATALRLGDLIVEAGFPPRCS